jgi:hypothetical protein
MGIPECPSCKAPVWREVFSTRGRPFECRNCRTLLDRTDRSGMLLAVLLANAVAIAPFLFPALFDSAPVMVAVYLVLALAGSVAVGLIVYLLRTDVILAGSVSKKE